MERQNFDFDAFKKQAASRLKKGDTLLGKDGVLTPLLKVFCPEIGLHKNLKMEQVEITYFRYPEELKRQVIREYQSGHSMEHLRRKYNIKGQSNY